MGMTEPARSPEWPKVRRAYLKANPTCAACGSRLFREVHHVEPFHLHPELELDPANLITLCEMPFRNHHLKVGHLGNWKNWNPNVRADAAHLLNP